MRKGKFLSEVQHELEKQRQAWGSEIKRLTEGVTPDNQESSKTTSLIDQSSGKPVFKAFFDVREFDRKDINVRIDHLINKVVVKATKKMGVLTRTLTQKANLPRFSDNRKLSKKIGPDGILEVSVPLLYYFPPENEPKSYVYRVDKQTENGKKCLEIVVNTGEGINPEDVDVQVVDDNELIISGESTNGGKNLRKKYYLPQGCSVDDISAEIIDKDHVTIYIPIYDKR
ncbi:unnamed protein product [Dimorphilus gyrociliatus]|uniref:SHSP domain-containing protein n=1 Tax=Dimorphilus gyrociliatus TaxID=2664684 RepID=A0A7I8VS48_9ANNE|nr:unnamed protein product [Dimorphilus gyrociliatus]